jgi:hypothetical protein
MTHIKLETLKGEQNHLRRDGEFDLDTEHTHFNEEIFSAASDFTEVSISIF